MSLKRNQPYQEVLSDPPAKYKYIQNGKFYTGQGLECNEDGELLEDENNALKTKVNAAAKEEFVDDDVVDLTTGEEPDTQPDTQAAPATPPKTSKRGRNKS